MLTIRWEVELPLLDNSPSIRKVYGPPSTYVLEEIRSAIGEAANQILRRHGVHEKVHVELNFKGRIPGQQTFGKFLKDLFE
jgi:hypothetical protein